VSDAASVGAPRRADLDALYRTFPSAFDKDIDHLDDHCRAFIARSPFLVLATVGEGGACDASPKGGPPGFVQVLDDHHLAWGDLSGNNRLDSFRNLGTHDGVGLLFLIPGLDETLRVNGRAVVTDEPAVLDACVTEGRRAKTAVHVRVEQAFVHCAKAFRRSALWEPDRWPPLDGLPSAACMLMDHAGVHDVPEQAAVDSLEENYRETMWVPGGDLA